MATKTHQHALVLSDVVSHGLKAGQILQASPDLVKALVAKRAELAALAG